MLKKSFVMNKNCHSAKVTGRRARKVEGGVFFVSMSQLKVGVQSVPHLSPCLNLLWWLLMCLHDHGYSHSTNQRADLTHHHMCCHVDPFFTSVLAAEGIYSLILTLHYTECFGDFEKIIAVFRWHPLLQALKQLSWRIWSFFFVLASHKPTDICNYASN